MIVATQNVFAGKNNFLIRYAHVDGQPHDAWKRHHRRYRTKHLTVVCFNQFCFSEPKEDDGFLHIAYAERLVVVIKHENFPAEFAICANSCCFNAEDSIPSFRYISKLAQMFLEEFPSIPSKI